MIPHRTPYIKSTNSGDRRSVNAGLTRKKTLHKNELRDNGADDDQDDDDQDRDYREG